MYERQWKVWIQTIIDTGYEIGQTVYYVKHSGLAQRDQVAKANIQGFQIRKSKDNIIIGVDFKCNNNVPIDFVSTDINYIQKLVDKFNSKDSYFR
jgi:hypothetical protein